MAHETYKLARARLHRQLSQLGWRASRPSLKVLWAERSPRERVWFKAQAVYLNDHSMFADIRGMSVSELVARVDRETGNRTESPYQSEAGSVVVTDESVITTSLERLPAVWPAANEQPERAPVASEVTSEPAPEPAAAVPCKLRSGRWGARVFSEAQEDDVIQVTTRGGKSWLAIVTRVFWTDGRSSIVATVAADEPPASVRAPSAPAPRAPVAAEPVPPTQPSVRQAAPRPAAATVPQSAPRRAFRKPSEVKAA